MKPIKKKSRLEIETTLLPSGAQQETELNKLRGSYQKQQRRIAGQKGS